MFPGFEAAKAYVALVGAIATALLGIYGPDTQVGQVLTVVVAIATAIATFAVPNRPSPTRNQAGAVSVVEVLLIVLVVAVILALVGVL